MVSACAFCERGWVFVGTSAVGTDEMGPCPHCEAGQTHEARYYGAAGYWQGREVVLEPRYDPKPMPNKEGLAMARQVQEYMARAVAKAALERASARQPAPTEAKPSLDDLIADSEAA